MFKDWSALAKSFLVTALLLVIALGVRWMGFSEGSVGTFTLLAVAFLAAFAMTSGRLSSLSGPGGFSASFQQFLGSDLGRVISKELSNPVTPERLWTVAKGAIENIPRSAPSGSRNRPAALVLKLQESYDPGAIMAYANSMKEKSKSFSIFIVDSHQRYIGRLEDLPGVSQPGLFQGQFDELQPLVEAVAGARSARDFQYADSLDRDSLARDASVKDLLEYFVSNDKDSVVIVDRAHRAVGLVYRMDLLTDFLRKALAEVARQ